MVIADIDHREYFSPERLAELNELFHSMDSCGEGSLNEAEVHALFKKMNRNVSKQQVRELFSQFDSNKNGDIDLEEFCVMEIRVNRLRPRASLINYNDYLEEKEVDKLHHLCMITNPSDGVIHIGKPQLYQVLDLAQCKATQEEVDEVFADADSEDTGELDFNRVCAAFAVLMRKRRKINYREFLRADQVIKWRQLFASVDTAHRDKIGVEAVAMVFRHLGFNLRIQNVKALFAEFDADGSGDIDFSEFCVMILRLRQVKQKREVNPKTCNCWDLWKQEQFTLEELQVAGFRLEDLKKAGIPVGVVYKSGHASALQLRRAGFSVVELRRGGVGAEELRRCGFSLTDLRNAGFSVTSVQEANKTLLGSLAAGDLSCLPQQRPRSTPALWRGAKQREFPTFEAGVPCQPAMLKYRPLTAMIRDHTDWRPNVGAEGRRPETI